MALLFGPSFGPADGGAPKSLVVLLHGLGADGQDLIGLAPFFAQSLRRTLFLAPDAPERCDMAPMGRQWFSLQSSTPAALLAGTRGAARILDRYLDEQLAALGLSEADLALVGFSQGTMMALHVALRRKAPIACVLGYSGLLVAPEALGAEIRSRPPVLLVHGEDDPVVPFANMAVAEQTLRAQGVAVQSQPCPGLDHGIDEAGIAAGAAFLGQALAQP